jgi:hypothetical protein
VARTQRILALPSVAVVPAYYAEMLEHLDTPRPQDRISTTSTLPRPCCGTAATPVTGPIVLLAVLSWRREQPFSLSRNLARQPTGFNRGMERTYADSACGPDYCVFCSAMNGLMVCCRVGRNTCVPEQAVPGA